MRIVVLFLSLLAPFSELRADSSRYLSQIVEREITANPKNPQGPPDFQREIIQHDSLETLDLTRYGFDLYRAHEEEDDHSEVKLRGGFSKLFSEPAPGVEVTVTW